MAATFTSLSTIITRMQKWSFASKIEEQYLVGFLDDGIRAVRRKINLPWTLKKSTLRVFDGIFKYPVESDHDELAYIDNQNLDTNHEPARFRYTSLQEFNEDYTNRNQLAEIWESGSRYLGVKYKNWNAGSRTIDNAETASRYTASGDASAVTLDNVVFYEGNGSIRFTVTSSSGSAVMTVAPTSFADTNYQRKYFFVYIYLDSAPTSITLKFGNGANDNLQSAALTTQFSGEPFKADDWNLVGFDLNTATANGTLDSSAFDYYSVTLTGAASGTYYIDSAYLKSWKLMDRWYYSTYNVATVGQSVPNQEYFNDSNNVYATDSRLVGDSEWADVIQYEALALAASDNENDKVVKKIEAERQKAWDAFEEKYPDMVPVIITKRWNFGFDIDNYTGGYEQTY